MSSDGRTERATRRGLLRLAGGALAGSTGAGAAGAAGAAGERSSGDRRPRARGCEGRERVRFATYNVTDLRTEQVQRRGDEQAAAAAEVIQEVRPDVLLINELTNNRQQGERAETPNPRAFVENYLARGQRPDLGGIDYEYAYMPPSNTGVHSGTDLDKNGVVDDTPGDGTYGDDAFGFGTFPGQYALSIVSRYPLDLEHARTLRTFRWTDMPDDLAVTGPVDGGDGFYLTESEADRFRLSSKTHVDVPVETAAGTIHALAAHPTPPAFDGDGNFNGRRCHDEVRLLADYARDARYVYDDDGVRGGLAAEESFVVMGDMNAAPGNAESLGAASLLLDHERIDARRPPTSPGGAAQGVARATATFDGGSTVDYVLPSDDLRVGRRGVVWPVEGPLAAAVGAASDHRMVWADVAAGD